MRINHRVRLTLDGATGTISNVLKDPTGRLITCYEVILDERGPGGVAIYVGADPREVERID